MKTPFNELILVTVTPFSGTDDPDKNGKMPVMLQCIAGTMPNRNVLAGTVAERQGFELEHTYLIQMREIGYDKDFGPQFNWIKVMEVKDPIHVFNLKEKMGTPFILEVEKPDGLKDQYERQTDAVEGITTERTHMGRFEPSFPRTSTDHSTAKTVKRGTSQDSPSKDFQLENLNEDKSKEGDKK